MSVLVPVSSANSALRIIDGRDAKPGKYPFVVALEKYTTTLHNNIIIRLGVCGGAAVSATWIITARHCVNDDITRKKTINNLKIERKARYYSSSKKTSFSACLNILYLPHKRLNSLSNDDVALVKTEPILIDKYARVSALDFTTLYGHEVTVAGYGFMRESDTTLKLPVLSNKPLQVIERAMLRSCDSWEQKNGCTFPSMSLVPPCGQRPMLVYGDSGSPVLHPSGVVGVISRGYGFLMWDQKSISRSKNLIVITPLSPYINWITKAIAGE